MGIPKNNFGDNKMDDLKISERGGMKDIQGNKIKFKINNHVEIEATSHRLPNYPRKVISLQELVFPTGRKTIRICYYLKINNKWNYRQSPPFIQKNDLQELIQKAQKIGIISDIMK